MQEDKMQQPIEQPIGGGGSARLPLHYFVIAAAFFAIGMLVGNALQPTEEAGAVMVDEAQVRSIVQSVLEEHEFAAPTDEVSDRFALVDDDPYQGEVDAPVVIVEFSDFFCTYCKRHFDQTFRPVLENYGQHIRYVYRDFARLTPESTPAAAAAQCAFAQGKFWDFHSAFFDNQESLGRDYYVETAASFDLNLDEYIACLDESRYVDEVEIDGLDGQLAGVRGTPGFFINGQILSGAQPYSIFERMIQRELEKAGIDYR